MVESDSSDSPGHPLYKGVLTPLAKCGRCYQSALFGTGNGFALTSFEATAEPAQLPDPATERFEDYGDAFAAMQRHASSCAGRRKL